MEGIGRMLSFMKVDNARQKTIIRAIIVGMLVGAVVSSFRWLVELALRTWLVAYDHINSFTSLLLVLLVFVVLTVVVGKIIKGDKNVNGSGIPQVEAELAGKLDVNPFSIFWRKYVAGLITIGSGAFLGREGPSVQLGAAVGEIFATLRKHDKNEKRLLIAMGSAAGLSAAFGAPLAGSLFILEEVYRSFSLLVWLGTLTSAIFSDIVSSYVFGLRPVLSISINHQLSLGTYPLIILVGIGLGILGYVYQWTTLRADKLYKIFWWLPRQYHFFFVFITILPIGVYWPKLLGGGSGLIASLALNKQTVLILLLIFLLRFILSAVAFGSDVPGGIFLPILTLGAVIGSVFGTIFIHFGLIPSDELSNMVVLGMVGYFASISKAPFTAIILIAEMVGTMNHLVPMALVALVAYITIDLLGGEPIYESLLAKLNIPTKLDRFKGNLERMTVIVAPHGKLADQAIRQLGISKEFLIQQVIRGGKSYLPNGDFILAPGDELILLTDESQWSQIWDTFNELNKG